MRTRYIFLIGPAYDDVVPAFVIDAGDYADPEAVQADVREASAVMDSDKVISEMVTETVGPSAARPALPTWAEFRDRHVLDGRVDESIPTSSRLGQQFTANEIAQAVVYLSERALIEGTDVSETAHLTAKAVDCAESGKPVSEFLNPPQLSSGPTFHVRIDGSQNVAVGTQSGFTQNNAAGAPAAGGDDGGDPPAG
jgi:hypothetical protein